MALRKVGVIFTAEGYSQYMGELKQVSQEMRTMATQSKLAVAQLGNNASITSNYSTKIKSMGAEIQVAGNRTKMLSDLQKTLGDEQKRLPDMIEKSTQKYKESNATTKELKKTYTDLAKAKGEDAEETLAAEKAYKSSLRETNNLKKEMKELEVVYAQNGKQLEKLPNDLAKAELATQRLTNAQQKLHTEYRNQGGWLADTAKKWDDFGNSAIKTGDNLQKAGGYMTSRFTVPIIAGYTAATKVASDFHTEIGQLGPLLAEGGNITAEHRKQMDLLGESSRAWAIDYGKNTSDINTGMAELIRNGYNSAQVMGMIPNLLDASIASGEDFNAVMHTSANVLSQFQLRGKDTNETLANTQRVVDSLTYVANATSSGFGDLGAGMAYVGPVANTLNMSIEETASLLGILSDNGIEASQGGTALRGALTRLLKPSKQNADAMEELGINVEDYKKGLLDFPTILDTIAENTKNLTDEQKAALIAQAFGTESQSAMNALVTAGGDALRDMTSEAQNASGATKEIADAMKELPEFKFQQMWAEVRDLGIEVGTQLLPHVLTAVDAIGDWVSAFSDLDESTQGFIIKAGLAVAAIGPLTTGLGSVVKGAGFASKRIGEVIKTIGKWTTPKAIGETATELGKIPGAAGQAGGATASFINPWLAAGVLITGVIAGIGVSLYNEAQAPHKAHQESVKETEGKYQEWFDAVVAGNGTISELNAEGVAGADEMASAYEQATQRIMQANREVQDAMDMQFGEKSWQDYFQQPSLEVNWKESKTGQGPKFILTDLQKTLVETGQISQTEMSRISQSYNQAGIMLNSVMSEMSSAKFNNEKVTVEWAGAQIKAVKEVATSTVENLNTVKEARIAEIENQRELGLVTESEARGLIAKEQRLTEERIQLVNDSQARIHAIMKDASAANRKLNSEEVTTMMFDIMQLAEVTGQSFTSMGDASKVLGENLEALTGPAALGFLEGMGIIDKQTAINIASMENMEEKTKAVKDILIEYGLLEPDTKDLGIDTTDIDVALMAIEELANAWNDLTFEERLAQVETRGKEEIEDLMERLGVDWESLSPSQKEYYAQAVGGEALENILYLTEEWDRQTDPKTKYAILETQIDSDALLAAIEARDLWNNADFMSLAMEIDTNAPDAKSQLVELVNYFIAQEGLAPLQMEAEALTEDAQQKLADLISAYTGAPVEDVLEFLTNTNADETEAKISAATEAHETAGGLGIAEMDTSTNADTTTGKLETTGTTLGGLDGRSATVTVNLNDNATARLQGVGGLLTGLNGRVATSYVDTVSRSRAEFAEGGHITPFATGGNIQWGGMFANGGNVPKGFAGIVGEAGPEIFQVTNKGVSITPLSSTEKMRGVEGAIEDYMQGKSGSGDTYQVNINIDSPRFTDKKSMNSFTQQAVREMDRAIGKITKTKKRGLAT